MQPWVITVVIMLEIDIMFEHLVLILLLNIGFCWFLFARHGPSLIGGLIDVFSDAGIQKKFHLINCLKLILCEGTIRRINQICM